MTTVSRRTRDEQVLEAIFNPENPSDGPQGDWENRQPACAQTTITILSYFLSYSSSSEGENEKEEGGEVEEYSDIGRGQRT